MEKFLSLSVTLAAYSDTFLGFLLRSFMVLPVGFFDPELALYMALALHF